MKKKTKPKIIDTIELNKKSTKELLGYLKRLQMCEESFESSDLSENIDLTDTETIYFKSTEKWKLAYHDVKSILAYREHIPNKSNI